VNKVRDEDIAIIGISIRFPGAKNHNIFWKNLCDKIESITFFNNDKHTNDENYVNAVSALEDIDLFDATYFGFNKKDAQLTDPQHRIFLECSSECFEDAGYNPSLIGAKASVFAGANMSSYFINNLNPIYNPDHDQNFLISANNLRIMIGNDKDYLPTKVSYKLNLRGPSVNVQTACSTSLVAVHMACDSLIKHECDFALAGAANIQVPQNKGYTYQEGMILSADGHCRAFDSNAGGTIFGNGVGVVLLKLAKKAIEDGDNIYAIIKATAINNDGFGKMAFTAPSAEGQSSVIKQALLKSGLCSEDISFVEAHGTGTMLGDPIEVAALSKAFSTNKKNYCALGSVKTNIGHLGWAAGMAGLIKVALALKYKNIPATLHIKKPNPLIDIENTPFFINSELIEWSHNIHDTRHAAVSSFGVGGTNVHIILSELNEEQQRLEDTLRNNQSNIFLISAKNKKALHEYCLLFYDYLKDNDNINLLDLCFTVNESRGYHTIKKAFKVNSIKDLSNKLLSFTKVNSDFSEIDIEKYQGEIAFLFGTNHTPLENLGSELYQENKVFKENLDECGKIFYNLTGENLLEVIFSNSPNKDLSKYKKYVLFALEVSIAKLWLSWGIIPFFVLGHGLGKISAAYICEILTLEDGLRILIEHDKVSKAIEESDETPEKKLKLTLESIDFKQSVFHFVNACSGDLVDKQLYNSEYWINYLLDNSISGKSFDLLRDMGVNVFLEITPNKFEDSAFKAYYNDKSLILPSLKSNDSEFNQLLDTVVELCYTNTNINWKEFFLSRSEKRFSKISLPTYPFQKERFWLGKNT